MNKTVLGTIVGVAVVGAVKKYGSKSEILSLNLPQKAVFEINFRLYDDDKRFIDSFINGFNGIQSDMFLNLFRITLSSLGPEDLGPSGFVDFKEIADLRTLTLSDFSYEIIEYEGPKGVAADNPFAMFFEKNLTGFNRYDFKMVFSADLIQKHKYKAILSTVDNRLTQRPSIFDEEDLSEGYRDAYRESSSVLEDHTDLTRMAANDLLSLIGTAFMKTVFGMYDKRITPTSVKLDHE